MFALAVVIGLGVGRFVGFQGTAPADGAADAVEALRDHLEDHPDDVVAWQRLGTAHLEVALETAGTANYVAARDAFARAEELAPGHSVTNRGRAFAALGLHQFGLARDLAEAAHEARPYDSAALAALVDAEVELGRYEEATRRLDDLLAIRPDAAALARVSYLRELHGDGDGALDAILQARIAAERAPREAARIDVLAGDLHLARGELDLAGAAYERALEAWPDLAGAVLGEAKVLAAKGNTDDALALLEQNRASSSSVSSLMLQVELYAMRGRQAEAAELDAVLDGIVDVERSAGFGLEPAAALHETTWGDPVRGLELARSVHDARPAQVGAADALAWALLATGDIEGAEAVVDDAVRLDTYDAALHYRAAEVYAASGRDDEARRHLERSLSINPNRPTGLAPGVDALARRLGVELP